MQCIYHNIFVRVFDVHTHQRLSLMQCSDNLVLKKRVPHADVQAHERCDFHQANSTIEPLYDVTSVLVCVAANLVKGLLLPEFGAVSHVIRVIDRRLGFVAVMETFRTECDTVVNSSLSSDRIDGSASGNEPFFTVWNAVAGSIDMGMGHSRLVKLCRFLSGMTLVHHKTITSIRVPTRIHAESSV